MSNNLVRVCEYVYDMGLYRKNGVISMTIEQYQDAVNSGRKLLFCPFCDSLGHSLPESVRDWK